MDSAVPAGVDDVTEQREPEAAQEVSIPVGEALEGMDIVALPADMKWVGALMLIKTEDDLGGGGWSSRRTEGLSDEELLGVLSVQIEMLRERIRYRTTEM